jgi:diguanylate cyclase (GGDEF)-like protein/PAS domain S-box-containing protein
MAVHGKCKTWLRALLQSATLAGVILVVACWFAVAFVLSIEQEKATEGALKQSDGLVRLFEQNVVDVVERIDRTLLFLRKSFEDDPAHFDLRGWAKRTALVSDETIQLSLVGADGYQAASTTDYHGPPLYLGDREHFRKQLDPAIDKLFISEPVLGRLSGKRSIQFTRRLRGVDGSFAGVIVISIDPNFIERFYGAVDIGANGSVVLRNHDGVILAAQGFSGDVVGRLDKQKPFLDAPAQSRSGHYWGGAFDGKSRLVSYRASEKFSLVFAVGLAEDDILSGYRKHRTIYVAAASVVTLLILIAMAFNLRHQVKLDRNRQTLKQLNEDISKQNVWFDAALTNMPSGLSMFDADGKLLVWNNRYVEIYGMSPDVVRQGVSITTIIEHRKQAGNLDIEVETYIGEFRQALVDFGSSTSTTRLKDGRTIYVTNTATAGGGWVGIHEDITERLRDEAEIFDQATELARTNMRFEAALGNMTQGLCLFDAEKKLVIANSRFREMYDIPAELTAPGTLLPRILQHHVDHGVKSDRTIDEHVELMPKTPQQNFTTTDGREIAIKRAPTPEGGWVATHEDVTEQRRQEKLIKEKAAELELMNARFDAALRNMSQGICLFDADQRVVVSNARYAELYHLSHDQVAPGTTLRQILELRRANGIHFETPPETYVTVNVKQANEIQKLADGRFISIKRQPMVGGGWLTTHEDVTAEKRSQRLLAEKAAELEIINDRFDAALSNMSQGISMFDGRRRLVVWNARYGEIYQLPQTLLKVGTAQEDIAHDIVSRGVAKGRAAAADREHKDSDAGGHPTDPSSSRIEELNDGRVILLSRQAMSDGGWLTTHEDITERRRAEKEIIHLARHDPLTGLANRAEFNARLEEATKRLKRNGGAIAVMMLDLDKFKAVNDTLGHPAGDQLLVEVARRLKSSVRETDVLARLGGDEFAIIQEGAANQHEAALALRIINAICQPFDLGGQQASVGTSIGIVLAPQHGSDPEELLKRADLALYNVKAGGRNDFRIFQSEMLEVVHSQQSAESELRDAIARDEFELHYQPQVDAKTRQLGGVEALVRWRHPTKGLVPPNEFIPLAESTGLIVPLGEWVLQQACRDAASWPAKIKVAVNLSAVQFKKGNLFDVILCTLVESGLAPERLELEITETALLENQGAHLAMIRQLKNLGISLALDDFGTGHSSINYLTIFPFDKIKIDKSFTQGVLKRRDYKAVVAATLALAQGLGTVTTAEGVETEEQFDYMREAGVDLVQGYLFGRPVPARQLDLHGATLPEAMVPSPRERAISHRPTKR